MKYIHQLRKFRSVPLLLLGTILLLAGGCEDKGTGWADERYLTNFEFYLDHPDPKTGVPYTDEELAELSYDPKKKEQYSEGQQVALTLVTSKMPAKLNVLDGRDLSVLETITEFTPAGDKFRAKDFVTSLEDLGLIEPGDKAGLKFSFVYQDGSVGASYFEVDRIKFIDPNEKTDLFAFLKKSTGETEGLLTDEKVTSKVPNPGTGYILDFNGVDNQVEIANVPTLNFRYTNNFSVGIWVKTTATNSDPSMVGDKDWGSGSNPGFIFAFKGDDGWKLNAGDGSNRIDIDGNPINDGNWHFLMATFDRSGNATVYEDGKAVGSADISGFGAMESGYPIRIAQDGTGAYGDWFQGQIGEIFIYDYSLTPDQVAGISTLKTGASLRHQGGVEMHIPVTTAGGASASAEDGKFAYTFNGTDGMAAWNNGSDLDFRKTGDFTVGTWVRTTAANSDPSIIGDKDWGSGKNPSFIFAFTGGNWKLNAGDGTNRIDMDGGIINDGSGTCWPLPSTVMAAPSSIRTGNRLALPICPAWEQWTAACPYALYRTERAATATGSKAWRPIV